MFVIENAATFACRGGQPRDSFRSGATCSKESEASVRLATFQHGTRRAIGVVRDSGVIPIESAFQGATDLTALLAAGDRGTAAALNALHSNRAPIPLADVQLCAPVLRPGKFLALASNYGGHVAEILRAKSVPDYVPPRYPKWFNKQVTCICGPYDDVELPRAGEKLDYEAELAFIIGKRCRHVSVDDAPQVIAGYTVCNDFSMRDWQKHSTTITIGKSFDTHGPLGPWLVTNDEIGDPHALRLTCSVNGEPRQDGSTGEMIFSCYEQIAYLSQVCTLEPGDVIATGTPSGVGNLMSPPRYLKVGDVVRCEIERIGFIENVVVREQA